MAILNRILGAVRGAQGTRRPATRGRPVGGRPMGGRRSGSELERAGRSLLGALTNRRRRPM